MDGETRDDGRQPATPADGSDEGLGRLAARAYRPTRVEVDEALRHDWLEIWYQPKIDLQRNRLVGAEALARIRHPDLGVLLPKSFLPTMWDEGLAHLTEHVLRIALRDWSILDKVGFNLHLSVNAPVDALMRLPIAALVADDRPKVEHWPGLILEVTQDRVLRDLDHVQRLAKELQASAVSLSIDDFGTRYSWLSQVAELAFAELKIDNGFVKNCAVDTENAAICQRVIDLAHLLDSVVVAKGIESGADLETMRRMGCDFGQGVQIAPPMPMEGFLELLNQRLSAPSVAAQPVEPHPPQGGRARTIDRVA